MANTYSQIYIQIVFAVDGRLSLIRPEFKAELFKYMTGIVRNQGQKLIAINGVRSCSRPNRAETGYGACESRERYQS
jgi:hypothetical protein